MNSISESIRGLIVNVLAELGWSAYRLAKESGVPESTVREYLSGKSDTSTKNADAMIEAGRLGIIELRRQWQADPE